MTELFNEHKEKVFEVYENYFSQEDHPEKMSMIHDDIHKLYNAYYEQCCTPNPPLDLKTISSPEEYREATKVKQRYHYVRMKVKKTQQSKTTVTNVNKQLLGKDKMKVPEVSSKKNDVCESPNLNNAEEGTVEDVLSSLNDEKDTNKNVNSKLESESLFNIDNDNDEEDKSDNCEVSGNFR